MSKHWSLPTEQDLQPSNSLAEFASSLDLYTPEPVVEPNGVPVVEEVQPEQGKQNVVWEPIPNSSQAFALTTRADHTLMHGARGPGKTLTQLMRFRSRVGIGYGSYWRGVIFDREFRHLADMVAQGNRFFPLFEDGVKWINSPTEYKWVWPTGEELLLRHVKKVKDYDSFHGHEYAFIGWNELTKHPTSEVYDKFMSVNRSSFVPEKHTPTRLEGKKLVYDTPDNKPLPKIPLEVFSTTNPNGPGHTWVKMKFIDVAKNGEIVRTKVTFYDNLKREEIEVVKKQVAIFGSFFENPYLPDDYRANLIQMCESNENLKKAWIEGSWDVNEGGAIDDLWKREIHVVDRFPVPASWYLNRSFDWGSTHPFSVQWWAEANGEEMVLPNGTVWCPTRGSLILFEEDYGTKKLHTNQGLKMSAPDIAERVLAKEEELKQQGWIKSRVHPGPADNQIRNVTQSDEDTIETKMKKKGVSWTESDKSAGSRVIGLDLFRDRLQASVKGEGPGIYFMRNCQCAIQILPHLPRDEKKLDDVDTEAEDHLYDSLRYRVLKGSNKIAAKVITRFPG